ncbi:MAG: hypothetical protein E2O39_09835 [Planctomycetota bacterium]|nr:MAG: hypothetical protein E2O39_09835 [Planctomycetota bacterium]
MQRVLLSLALLALSSSLGAEGLVQITLEGTLHTVGGARIEFEVGARANGEPRQVVLGLHLAESTTCSDLATLLTKRLERGGFEVLTTRSDDGGTPRVQIFVENTIFVRMRLGGGLEGTITVCEEGAAAVRIVRPQAHPQAAELVASASTFHLHTERRGFQNIAITLEPEFHGAQISDILFRESIAHKWLAERPGTDFWRPMGMADGAQITGLSIKLRSEGDWRIEVELDRR